MSAWEGDGGRKGLLDAGCSCLRFSSTWLARRTRSLYINRAVRADELQVECRLCRMCPPNDSSSRRAPSTSAP